MRRAGLLIVLLVVPALAGCAAPDDSSSQNLRTPLLVVDRTEDNLTTLYVHSAFTSEHVYDSIAIALDNATAARENHTYALTHKTNRTAFFLGVDVADGEDRFRYQAQLEVNATADILGVSTWTEAEDKLDGRRNATMPFKKVVPSYDPTTVEP